MDGLIKFPTVYMDDETAVNIVKHSLAYLESDELTFEAMTYAIERVAWADISVWKWERQKKRLEEMEGK